MTKFAVCIVLLGLLVPLGAQYPSQYPPGQYPSPNGNPPGTYPPGQYPQGGQYPAGGSPGGRGISIPKGKGKGKKQNQNSLPTFSQDGKTVSNDGKKLVIGTNDGRVIWFALTPTTKFTRSGNDIAPNSVIPRTTVQVDATEDEESFLTATHVDLLKNAVQEPVSQTPSPAKSAEPEKEVRPTVMSDAPVDAPDRPILRRGKPKDTESANTNSGESNSNLPSTESRAPARPAKKDSGDFTIDADSDQVKIVRTGDDLVDRTKEWAQTFTNGLPNYVCQQSTTRYLERSRSSGWEPLDVVTAKVVYEDGKEDYREITVGGRRTNKSMMDLGGSTSTGEFASTLRSLFAEFSQAQFKLNQSTRVGQVPAAIYDFKVAMPNSDWTISAGSQTLRPAYNGGVWIEKGTAQVRRIEMQAENIPKNFPLDSMEWTVDYEEIPLGTAKFLLPVHAENLGCWRGTSICTKNSTDFRDYHKYSGESTITFGK